MKEDTAVPNYIHVGGQGLCLTTLGFVMCAAAPEKRVTSLQSAPLPSVSAVAFTLTKLHLVCCHVDAVGSSTPLQPARRLAYTARWRVALRLPVRHQWNWTMTSPQRGTSEVGNGHHQKRPLKFDLATGKRQKRGQPSRKHKHVQQPRSLPMHSLSQRMISRTSRPPQPARNLMTRKKE